MSSTGGEETGVVKKGNSNDTRRNPETTGDIYVACDLEEQGVSVGGSSNKMQFKHIAQRKVSRIAR